MLKIKDNVDLKELENFGFKQKNVRYGDVEEKEYHFSCKAKGTFLVKGCTEIICVMIEDERGIYIETTSYSQRIESIIDVLFDLIQAGLVEKVVEEN